MLPQAAIQAARESQEASAAARRHVLDQIAGLQGALADPADVDQLRLQVGRADWTPCYKCWPLFGWMSAHCHKVVSQGWPLPNAVGPLVGSPACALQRMRLEAEAGRLQTAMDEAAQVLRHSEQRLRRAQLAQLIALGADMQSAEVQLAALRPGR